jgi:hypothetical protein
VLYNTCLVSFELIAVYGSPNSVVTSQVEVFRVEKRKFDLEVSKWDDTGNDIIVLAKHMCMIMMEMTDFTRGWFNRFRKDQ